MILQCRDDVIDSLFSQFSFVESDLDKFKSIVNKDNFAKTLLDYKKCGKKNIEEYLAQSIKLPGSKDEYVSLLQSDGDIQFVGKLASFVDIFVSCSYKNGAEFAFHFFNYFITAYNIEVTNDDLYQLCNVPTVYSYFTELVKKYPDISKTGDLSFTANKLLAETLKLFIRSMDDEEVYSSDSDNDKESESLDFDDEELFGNDVNVSLIEDEATRYLYMSGGSNVLDSQVMDEEVLKMRAGDEEAAKKVISSVNKLILSLANYYSRRARNLTVEDLCQEGQIGLLHAVKIYDVSKNVKFTTHAVYWIRQAMQRAVHNQDRSVRIPVHKHILMNNIRKCRKEFVNENLREPTVKEISLLTGLSQSDVNELLKLDEPVVSLDKPVGEDEDVTVGDFVDSGDDAIETFVDNSELSEHHRIIEESLKILNEQETFVIRNYFGLDGEEPKSTVQISKMLGLTHQRICQVLSKAMRKLKNQNGILIDKPIPGLKAGTSNITPEMVIGRKERATQRLFYKTRGKLEILAFDDVAQYARFHCIDCGFKWQAKISSVVSQYSPKCPNCHDKSLKDTGTMRKKTDGNK